MGIYRFVFILASLFLTSAFGKVEITKVKFKKELKKGMVTIYYKGQLKDLPEMSVTGRVIQVVIPNSTLKENIDKAVSFSSSLKDTKIKAYQGTKGISKIKTFFAFKIKNQERKVALTIKEDRIELVFPRVLLPSKKPSPLKAVTQKSEIKKEFLDEKYLNTLLSLGDEKKSKKNEVKEVVAKVPPLKKDMVNSKQASLFKGSDEKKTSISLLEYGGKFVAFLGFVLLLFYGVAMLMKKGFIKKGKLGFFNNAEQITVINQTYISPKKSLMLIKAHNQVFLVSNTDNGIHPISEISDVAGLLKEGEKSISGQNFDTNLGEAQLYSAGQEDVKIKEDISTSNQKSSLSSYLGIKEKVKFSDQLKKKVKNLKPLQ